jgi:hypothetical protein
MQPRTIFAEPITRYGNSSWLNAYTALLVFEQQHTIEHPAYGRVVAVENNEDRLAWQQLLDAEAAAYQALLAPAPIEDHPIAMNHELVATES